LPNYMIPSAFVLVDGIPLTPSGKVNAAKLVQLEVPHTERSNAWDEPTTDMEKTLVTIWKEALGLDQISVHDNFFEIGGHSLLSIQVITRLENRIGLRVNPREFIYQTLGQLAASIERQRMDSEKNRQPIKKKGFWNAIKQKMTSTSE
jgi:acyl carrier protein